MFCKNAGSTDRILRIAAGVILLGLAATGVLGAWAYIGIVPLVTGALGWCPLYTVLGFRTCKSR